MATAAQPNVEEVLARLEGDGLLVRDGGLWRTTAAWQRAMAHAAAQLYARGDSGEDLRVPIVHALLEIYGAATADDLLADYVAAILPIEARALGLPTPPSP